VVAVVISLVPNLLYNYGLSDKAAFWLEWALLIGALVAGIVLLVVRKTMWGVAVLGGLALAGVAFVGFVIYLDYQLS
jgi:hypothetical protein